MRTEQHLQPPPQATYHMQAVQTFWTNQEDSIAKMTGGWLDPRYHFMSWALSASLLARHFKDTVLHTDSTGKIILIDLLKLPYREVRVTQDGLEKSYPKNWWVMRKIHTYSLCDSPFIHVDGDAFLWNGLPGTLRRKQVIAQNWQLGFGCYRTALDQLRNAGVTLPAFVNDSRPSFDAVNMGVVGGTDYQFFHKYVDEIKQFYDGQLKQKAASEHLQKTGYLNTLLEECFFYQLAALHQKEITPLITETMEDHYGSLANCLDKRFPLTHLIGQNKQNIFHCKQIAFQLQHRFPAVYNRVQQFLDKFVIEKGNYHSHKNQDYFNLSNANCSKHGYSGRIHAGNATRMINRFQHNGNTVMSETIRFEQSKLRNIMKYLDRKEALLEIQRSRNLLVNRISNTPLKQRLADQVCYNAGSPILAARLPGYQKTANFSLVYDFEGGYEHITQRSLDDMSLFMIYCSEEPVSVGDLLQKVLNRTAHPDKSSVDIMRNIDLKMQELVLNGLLNYQLSNPTSIR